MVMPSLTETPKAIIGSTLKALKLINHIKRLDQSKIIIKNREF